MSRTTKTRLGSVPRRDFLRASAIGAASAALSPFIQACAQLDRIIVGDGSDETQSVMILGAGISGLTAARELKKMAIPFRVYEGSQRIGGRALTLDEFNVASQSIDLGAEWVSPTDDFVLNLCRELKLSFSTLSTAARTPMLFQGEQINEFNNILKNLKLADQKILQMKERLSDFQWDAISAEDILSDLRSSVDEKSLLWTRRMIELEWGTDPKNISALCLVDRFDNYPTGWHRALDKRIRIHGGVQNLAQALYDKIAGVVPGRFVLFDHKLIGIKDRGDRLQMQFETKQGNFSIDAKVVICTLPFSALRRVNGIDSLDFSPIKMKAIQELGYGTHGKMAMSFKEKFWSVKSHVWTGDLKSQWIWESGIDADVSFGSRGVLSAQLSGEAGQNIGVQSLNDFKEDIKKISPTAGQEENSQVMNWALNPWSQGSVSYFKPGQVHAFSSSLQSPERHGSFIFAGEHTSLNSMGTINGAIESGTRAAIEASHFKSQLGKRLI